jgi:tetratricopeptide (TPR) repeat protein
MSGQLPPNPAATILPPLPAAKRQQLQIVFDRAQQCAVKGERDYASDLLTQCVVEDPGNLIYLQHFLANLAQKYGNNKTGARLAGLKIKSSRSALKKATEKGEWREAFEAAANALRINPWDAQTLIALADACEQIGCPETEIFILRWALDVDPKDPIVNRRAAQAFGRMGQFDNAIGCWRRVQQAKPLDEESSKAISQLSVEQTIQKGGYQQEMLDGTAKVADLESAVRASMARGRKEIVEAAQQAAKPVDTSREQSLMDAIQASPADVSNYLELGRVFSASERYQDAERILTQALQGTGGGDLLVREVLEDAQLARVHQQVEIAKRRAEQDKTEEAIELAKRMSAQANLVEMEIYGARSARDPNNLMLLYELGLRSKRAGKFKEAIQAFQAARDDARHRAQVQLHLGESFQHIRQFKLALSSYEAAIEACDSMQLDTQKLALYRAGVLATEFKDLDRAEKYLTRLAAIDFGYRDVADRLDKLAELRDSV